VLTADDLPLLKDGAILVNVGHFPWEIDVSGLEADPTVVARTDYGDGITAWKLDDGRAVNLLTAGHMVNLAGPRPLGNSIESMDLGFALQARCLGRSPQGPLTRSPASCRSRGRSTSLSPVRASRSPGSPV
jgi:adenosylhomocysteinase